MQCREKKFAKYAKKAAKGLCVHLDGAAKVLKLLHKYVKKDAARPLMGARKAAARLLQGRCKAAYGSPQGCCKVAEGRCGSLVGLFMVCLSTELFFFISLLTKKILAFSYKK